MDLVIKRQGREKACELFPTIYVMNFDSSPSLGPGPYLPASNELGIAIVATYMCEGTNDR